MSNTIHTTHGVMPYVYASDVRVGDVIRVLPNVPGREVTEISVNDRGTAYTFVTDDDRKTYARHGGRVIVERFATERWIAP